jgi:hypothetical protein
VHHGSAGFPDQLEQVQTALCACNTHARRYFVKALDRGDKRAALPLAGYKKLDQIEAQIQELNPDDKLAERQAHSQTVWDALARWCHVHKKHETPASPLGVAVRYFTNHEAALGRFLEYGFVPFDNSIVERLHVRAALTRKNFLFAGSDNGGDRAAIALSIFGSCHLWFALHRDDFHGDWNYELRPRRS